MALPVDNIWSAIVRDTAAADIDFRSKLDDVEAVQRTLLARIISANRDTAFGHNHDFGGIDAAETFRAHVSIEPYEAFMPYLDRVLDGEANVLTSEPILFVEQTGGSTGGVKTIPYTAGNLASFGRALSPWLADLIRRRPGVTLGRSYFALSPVGRTGKERVGKVPIGSPAPFAYFGALRDALTALSAVPLELRLLTDFETWQWQTCLHLLAEEDLSLVWVWSPTYLTELLRAAVHNADTLLAALADRNIPLARLDRVRRALRADEPDFGSIWPRLDTISCWTDASSRGFAATLQDLLPRVFLQSKGLLSTEATVSFPYGEGDGSILASTSNFFDFVDRTGAARFSWEVEVGELYRVAVTTEGGLYRYDTGDTVEVVGMTGATPRLRFVGRAGLVADLCGEKLTEDFVVRSLGTLGLDAAAYALLVPVATPRPHYRLFIDGPTGTRDVKALARALDRALGANPQYAYARRIGQLDAIAPTPVDDLYGRIKRFRLRAGISIAGMKAPILMRRADDALLAALDAETTGG